MSEEKNITQVNDVLWIHELTTPEILGFSIGKWLLYYPLNVIDNEWKKLCELYRDKKLEGITYMKVSTNKQNLEKHENNPNGVVVLYVDPYKEKEILSIGNRLIDSANYTYSPVIYFKYDCPSMNSNKNHSLKLTNHKYIFPETNDSKYQENNGYIKFGKYKNRSFKEVFICDPDYCRWVLTNVDAYGNFLEFQNYLKLHNLYL